MTGAHGGSRARTWLLRRRSGTISDMPIPDGPAGHLTLQFLAWIGEAPRSYGEVMEAWRTSCPRLSIWEDALRAGLVAVADGRCAMREHRVTLTDRGRAWLQAAPATARPGAPIPTV
jgi:hypothetical protein